MTILLFILTIFFIIIPRFKENIMNGKREMIKELTNSAWSILAKYENDEREGILTRKEAQKTAISRIQYLRYGGENKDYFWITDMTPRMVMHPFRNDLNGKDLKNFKDPHGKRMFVEFVKTVKSSEHGYVDYMWQWKDDSLHIVPKLSYVKLFKPWNWVIGTGIYIEDVKKEIAALTKRMLWISIGISLTIAFLLLYISKQSLNIERKRIEAENKLHESKEKYRTLVEAATEGLIMLIDGKISFSNNVISKMTGFDNAELLNLSLDEIISKNNNKDIIDTFSKNEIKEGQFELNLRKKNGGFAEVLVTTSSAMFYGKAVNIIIVKDISIDKNKGISNIEYQKLISTLNVGFFKAKIDSKGKFIFANETALRILGFDRFEELSETHILSLLADADDRKSLRKTLMEKGFMKNKVLKVFRKNGDFSIVAVSLVVLNNENPEELICDGIVEDITLQENEKYQTKKLVAELKAGDILLEQPVSDFLSSINTLESDATINDAIQLLSKKKTDNLLISNNGMDFLGIITNTDIQKRVLSLNLSLDNPVYLIMSSPIFYISESTKANDAIRISREKSLNHLVVKNASGEISGILKTNDIYQELTNSLSFYLTNIEKAGTTDELRDNYSNLQLLINPMIKSDVSVKLITNITSSFSDAMIRRIIELILIDIGPPPVNFSFICMGSEGRQEETLLTDQDNAIIYDDVPKEKESDVNTYFTKLGERVCDSLNFIGYSFCKGKIMANNPQWCKPYTTWKKYFTDWIATPESQQLLDATIFFDFRNIYGDESFAENLKATITNSIKEHPLFLYHLAYNTFNTKPQHISTGNILIDKHVDIVDLKHAVIPIIMFARTYSLQNNLWCSNTIDRLTALKDKSIISDNTAEEILFVYNYLMKLRFRNQADLLLSNSPISNVLNTKNLIDIELYMLKKILAVIPEYQNKIKMDFRITT